MILLMTSFLCADLFLFNTPVKRIPTDSLKDVNKFMRGCHVELNESFARSFPKGRKGLEPNMNIHIRQKISEGDYWSNADVLSRTLPPLGSLALQFRMPYCSVRTTALGLVSLSM